MAMDALKNLAANIPDWQRKLDDLSGEVDRRQAELASVAANDPKVETRSLRNTGSTESLKPRDEGPLQPIDPFPHSLPPLMTDTTTQSASEAQKPVTPPQDVQRQQGMLSNAGGGSPPGQQKQTREAMAAPNSRAAARPRRRIRSASLMSADGATATYRTRSMIIVYYDSYVQGFFDDLVRFISSSRNLLRKAKMAARVAHIKRMAEMEVPEEEDGGDDKAEAILPSLRYMSTRRTQGVAGMSGLGSGGNGQPPDVYDSLDKTLEVIQSTCEHGAHQFLRDADCNDEIQRIRKRLEELLGMSRKEMERVERDEPELAKETGDMGKVRTRRPISMRRDMSSPQKEGVIQAREELMARTLSDQGPILAAASPAATSEPLEVDTNMDADEGIDIAQEIPKLIYRSTRYMQPRQTGQTPL